MGREEEGIGVCQCVKGPTLVSVHPWKSSVDGKDLESAPPKETHQLSLMLIPLCANSST